MDPPSYKSNERAGAPKACDVCDSYRTGMDKLAACARYERLVLLTSACDSFELRVGHDPLLLTPEEEKCLCGPWMKYPESNL